MRNKTILLLTIFSFFLPELATQAADVQIQTTEQSQVTVEGDLINAEGDVTVNKNYGLNEAKVESILKEQHELLLRKLQAVVGDEQKTRLLEKQLQDLSAKQADLKKTLAEKIQNLQEADTALTEIKGQLPDAQIAAAKKSLEKGDAEAAEQAFTTVANELGKKTAMAAFQSGRLAEDRLDYEKALHQYKKAVDNEEDNPDYLQAAGRVARILGDYDQATEWLDQLLKIREAEEKDDSALSSVVGELALLYSNQYQYMKT